MSVSPGTGGLRALRAITPLMVVCGLWSLAAHVTAFVFAAAVGGDAVLACAAVMAANALLVRVVRRAELDPGRETALTDTVGLAAAAVMAWIAAEPIVFAVFVVAHTMLVLARRQSARAALRRVPVRR